MSPSAKSTAKPKPIKATRNLIHKFTDEEVDKMTTNLCEHIEQITALEIEKKEVTADLGRKIKDLTKRNKVLAHKITDREEERSVAVEVTLHWPKDGIRTVTRMDTYEQWEEMMKDDENTIDSHLGASGANDEEE